MSNKCYCLFLIQNAWDTRILSSKEKCNGSRGYLKGVYIFLTNFEEIKVEETLVLTSQWKVSLTRGITTKYSVSFDERLVESPVIWYSLKVKNSAVTILAAVYSNVT